MLLTKGTGKDKNWIVAEEYFREAIDVKNESIMCQGNGYMCIRAAHEEFDTPSRWTVLSGTYNRLPEDHCNELVNSADFTKMIITVDGERITEDGMIGETYDRHINLRTALLEKTYTWKSSKGRKFDLRFRRVVTLKRKHLAAFCVEITNTSRCGAEITFETGIDGDTTAKQQHLVPVLALAEEGIAQITYKTSQSGILFTTTASVDVDRETDVEYRAESKTAMIKHTFKLKAGETVRIDKKATVYTNRDRERDGCSEYCLEDTSMREIKAARERSFECVAKEVEDEWKELWADRDVKIVGADRDQLAIRFAIYHLTCMTPKDDNRMNIGAKGISGSGYYGHAFWDTEIYMLPYFIFTDPKTARSLVEYRFNCLDACRKYAKEAGCEGARFPWESSWITDGESTPDWCDTGDLELHITADVALGAYYYYTVTGDEDFMEKSGYELIFECAKFWASDVKYSNKNKRYEILDVIGPDEYKTHVNNNAYTNYLAHNSIVLAMEYAKKIEKQNPALYARLDKKVGLKKAYADWEKKKDKIYLPRENENGIIPQDDAFLTLTDVSSPDMSISKDKEARKRAADIGYQNAMISKQADVVALLYLLEDLFTPECKKKNVYFYEHCCLHDSSLSLAVYSIVAADLHENDLSYSLFSRASMIDLDSHTDSETGIHAASLGGIWQDCVLGYGGVRRYGDRLRIQPNIPAAWKSITFCIFWQGQRLEVKVDHKNLSVRNLTGTADVQFLHDGKLCSVGEGVTIEL